VFCEFAATGVVPLMTKKIKNPLQHPLVDRDYQNSSIFWQQQKIERKKMLIISDCSFPGTCSRYVFLFRITNEAGDTLYVFNVVIKGHPGEVKK